MKYTTSLVCLTFFVSFTLSARILGIHPLKVTSHYNVMSPILVELAKRGHNVTVLTNIMQSKPIPNYHQIKVDEVILWNITGQSSKPSAFNFKKQSFIHDQKMIWDIMRVSTDLSLASPAVQDFINNDHTSFDLVMCEEFFLDAYLMFVHKYKAPLVLMTPFGAGHYISNYMGNPLELSVTPHEFLYAFGPMSFWERLQHVLCTLFDLIVGSTYTDMHDEIAARHFKSLPQPLPPIREIRRNASLVLLNTDFSIDMVRPYVPSVVEVGGMHVKKPKKLPEDLQKLLDGAKNGVIYFSLGSNLESKDMPLEKQQAFMNVFAGLKETVLWKWEVEKMENKPDNVFIRKWMPQNDILAHPNIKLFITHGGLLSALEALYNGVPMIGLPIFGDQYRNVAKLKYMGFGEGLDFDDLTEDSVRSVLLKVLKDPSYTTAAKEYSNRLIDKPQAAMERAIFWVEYVIRHKGAKHLKPVSVWMPWYQYYLLDIGATLLFTVIFAATIASMLVNYILRFYFGFKSKNLNKKNE